MKPAIDTLKRISKNEEDYDLYESRRLALLDLEAIKDDLREEVMAEMQVEIDKERNEKEQAVKEKERLLNLLRQSGIDPGQGS